MGPKLLYINYIEFRYMKGSAFLFFFICVCELKVAFCVIWRLSWAVAAARQLLFFFVRGRGHPSKKNKKTPPLEMQLCSPD